jgi:hypothetical protein
VSSVARLRGKVTGGVVAKAVRKRKQTATSNRQTKGKRKYKMSRQETKKMASMAIEQQNARVRKNQPCAQRGTREACGNRRSSNVRNNVKIIAQVGGKM